MLRTAMLAAIANEDYAAVAAIDEEIGRGVVGNGMTLPHRSYMLALADRRSGRQASAPRSGAEGN